MSHTERLVSLKAVIDIIENKALACGKSDLSLSYACLDLRDRIECLPFTEGTLPDVQPARWMQMEKFLLNARQSGLRAFIPKPERQPSIMPPHGLLSDGQSVLYVEQDGKNPKWYSLEYPQIPGMGSGSRTSGNAQGSMENKDAHRNRVPAGQCKGITEKEFRYAVETGLQKSTACGAGQYKDPEHYLRSGCNRSIYKKLQKDKKEPNGAPEPKTSWQDMVSPRA